jgi:hypothetical protein
MKTFTLTILAAASVLLAGTIAAAEPSPPPAPAYGAAANDLPLDVYRKIKALWDAGNGLFDFKLRTAPGTESGLVPEGVKSPADAKKALAAAAAEQKAVLQKALFASQVLHRELAAKALESCGDAKAAAPELAKALAADPDAAVRRACANSLGGLKDAGGVEALIKSLQDKEESVRGQAAAALGAIRDPRATASLLEVMAKDDKPAVRRRAANALTEIKDAGALEVLLKALETEQDYRVRMAIAAAIRAIRGQDTAQTREMPQEGGENPLAGLSKEMKDVEEKLRNDRHDQAVQVDQKSIEEKLTKLIDLVEQMQQQQQRSQGQQQQQQKQQQQGQQQGQGAKRPSSPMADSKLGSAPQRGALNPAVVDGQQAEWAKLPAAMRDEMMQVYREGMPERWRRRLEAYYLSVAAEEVQQGK